MAWNAVHQVRRSGHAFAFARAAEEVEARRQHPAEFARCMVTGWLTNAFRIPFSLKRQRSAARGVRVPRPTVSFCVPKGRGMERIRSRACPRSAFLVRKSGKPDLRGARGLARPPLGEPCDRPACSPCEGARPLAKRAAPPKAPPRARCRARATLRLDVLEMTLSVREAAAKISGPERAGISIFVRAFAWCALRPAKPPPVMAGLVVRPSRPGTHCARLSRMPGQARA
jgi:hypothetical protein